VSALFDRAFAATIGLEAGYINDPDDPGGETKFGISKRQYPDLDIPSLTLEQAKEIYLRDYWQPLMLGHINERYIACEVFDTAVNMGINAGVYIVQEALNFLGASLSLGGPMRAEYIAMVNTWGHKDPEAFFKVLNGFQFMHYLKIITRDPIKRKYARGWMRRIQGWRDV
jgi:lysozyme family protein